MSLMTKLRSTEVTPRTALLSIAVLVLATAGVLTAVVKLMNGAHADKPDHTDRPAPPVAMETYDPGKIADLPPGKPDYTIIIKRNLFRPVEGAVATIVPPATANPLPPPLGKKPASVPPFQPFANSTPAAPTVTPPKLAYTGVVEIAGETYALIEHLESHEAKYVRLGGTAFDCKATEITARAVDLEYAGMPFTLNLGENKTEPAPTPPPAAQPNNQPPPGGGQPPAAGNTGAEGPRPDGGGRPAGRGGRDNRGSNPENNPSGGG